ncbi:uncharacterized protein RAG0_10338 [Rhynchosporium agropyri]|uniref:Uncharacterized protein n=1 Tax=Rhynchosporium agropyri TaxID=914238 RepID=A0A1E1KZC3_9HELO|nr:uncharacterized protein RAG0_10338 [Rhynchosporium agropyri]
MSPIDHAGDYGVGQSSTISVRNFICTSLYRSQLALDKILDGSGATMKLVMPCISNRAIAFHEGELDRVPMFRPFFGFIQSSSTKSDVQSELSSGFDEKGKSVDIVSNELLRFGSGRSVVIGNVRTPSTQVAVMFEETGEYRVHDLVHELQAAKAFSESSKLFKGSR